MTSNNDETGLQMRGDGDDDAHSKDGLRYVYGRLLSPRSAMASGRIVSIKLAHFAPMVGLIEDEGAGSLYLHRSSEQHRINGNSPSRMMEWTLDGQ